MARKPNRRARRLEVDGVSLTVLEWAHRTGQRVGSIRFRLRAMYSDSDAVHGRPGANCEAYRGANNPWEADPIAQRLVRELGPMSLTAVGAALKIHRSRVHQIEQAALAKLFRLHGRRLAEQTGRAYEGRPDGPSESSPSLIESLRSILGRASDNDGDDE